jgi:hypothetical protein
MNAMRSIGHGMFAWNGQRTPDEYARIEEEIQALERMDLVGASRDDLKRALDAVGRGYITRRMWSVPKTNFRARRADELWSHVSELVAPPARYTRAGRFNEAGHPVRYFASDPSTALMEVRAKPNELYVLLVTRARKLRKPIRFAQFGTSKMPRSEAYQRGNLDGVFYGLAAEPRLKEFLDQRGARSFWLKQDEYFNELATAFYEPELTEGRYRLTNLLGEQMQRIRNVSGIFYPTAQNNYNGVNIAMPERLAAAAFRPLEAWLVQIGDRVDPAGVGVRYWHGAVVRQGTIDGAGDIEWGGTVRLSPEALHLEIAPMLPDLRRLGRR